MPNLGFRATHCRRGHPLTGENAVSKNEPNSPSGKARYCKRCRREFWAPAAQRKRPLYATWRAMIKRCSDPRHHNWKHYGGRGIRVCARWLKSYGAFEADMGLRPSPTHTLDRIDNDKGYSPQNCRWASSAQQARNKRGSRFATLNGVTKPLIDWAAERGLPYYQVHKRVSAGWSVERALTTSLHRNKRRHASV